LRVGVPAARGLWPTPLPASPARGEVFRSRVLVNEAAHTIGRRLPCRELRSGENPGPVGERVPGRAVRGRGEIEFETYPPPCPSPARGEETLGHDWAGRSPSPLRGGDRGGGCRGAVFVAFPLPSPPHKGEGGVCCSI